MSVVHAAIELQLRNGNLRDVFVQSYRSLDDDARRRVARIERVRTAEWAHVLLEVRPTITDDEARAAVHMVDGMLRSVVPGQADCCATRPDLAVAGLSPSCC